MSSFNICIWMVIHWHFFRKVIVYDVRVMVLLHRYNWSNRICKHGWYRRSIFVWTFKSKSKAHCKTRVGCKNMLYETARSRQIKRSVARWIYASILLARCQYHSVYSDPSVYLRRSQQLGLTYWTWSLLTRSFQ